MKRMKALCDINTAHVFILLKLYEFLQNSSYIAGILCKITVRLMKDYYRQWEWNLYLVSLYFLLYFFSSLFWKTLISQWITVGTWNLKETKNPETELVFWSEKRHTSQDNYWANKKKKKFFAPHIFKKIRIL